jgi:carbon storage regulator CsrA
MLVLTRKTEEKIVIMTGEEEDPIVITILRITGDKVSVGIKAHPKKVRIFREELLQEDIEKHNQKSLVNKNSLNAEEVARGLQMEMKRHAEETEPVLEAIKEK